MPGEERELNLKPWLFRVAHNECIDLIRTRRQTEDITVHEVASGDRVETTVATREPKRQVMEDLDHLPEQQRGALVMRELNGLTFEEIGLAIEASPGAAKQQVYEARCALQEQAEGRAMDCEQVRKLISERDGRRVSGRKVKAHLRGCEACSDFKAGIQARSRDLRSLVPPIPVALAASLAGITGGTGGGGGLLAMIGIGGGGGAAAGGGAMKAVAIVAVTAGVGAGTVGVVEGTRDANRQQNEPSKTSQTVLPAVVPSAGIDPAAGGPAGDIARQNPLRLRGNGPGQSGRPGDPGRPGNRPSAGSPPVGGSPVVPVAPPEAPGAPGAPGHGPPASPGGSGGANGNGATPAPGGKPADLPAASDKGQAQAGSSGNAATPGPPPDAGPPATAGSSGKGVPGGSGSGNGGKKDS